VNVGGCRAHRSRESLQRAVDVDRDRRLGLAGGRPLNARAGCHGQREQLIVGREMLFSQAVDVLREAVVGSAPSASVGIDGANARLAQPLDGGVGMIELLPMCDQSRMEVRPR
jgi:hypothetical protein